MAKAGPIDPPRVVCHHRGGLDRAPESCNPFIAVPMPFACERSSPGLFAQRGGGDRWRNTSAYTRSHLSFAFCVYSLLRREGGLVSIHLIG
jgi:hypothetical protein